MEVDGRRYATLDNHYTGHTTARVRYRIGESWHGSAVALGLLGGGDDDRAADPVLGQVRGPVTTTLRFRHGITG